MMLEPWEQGVQLGLSIHLLPIPWSDVGLCINNHLLHIEASLMRVKRLVHEYDSMSLRVDLILFHLAE